MQKTYGSSNMNIFTLRHSHEAAAVAATTSLLCHQITILLQGFTQSQKYMCVSAGWGQSWHCGYSCVCSSITN